MSSTAAVVEVEAFEISDAAEAATLLEFLCCGGCGELGRGASIAALATSGERPLRRLLRGSGSGRGRRAAANCCLGLGFFFFFFRRRSAWQGGDNWTQFRARREL